MNTFQQTITALEQELDAIDQRRSDLQRAIETLRPLAGDGPSTNGMRAKKADGRTDGRTDGARRAPTTRSLPDDADSTSAIVAAVRKAGGVMKPGDLAAALDMSAFTLRKWLKSAVKAKAIVVTGATMSRRVSLPSKGSAKEGL